MMQSLSVPSQPKGEMEDTFREHIPQMVNSSPAQSFGLGCSGIGQLLNLQTLFHSPTSAHPSGHKSNLPGGKYDK